MDYFSTDFLDFIDYSKAKTIEALYKYYNTIYKYAEKGNTAWASVLADLNKALEHANLNDKQKQCIEQYLINNNKIEDVAHHMNLVKSTIWQHTRSACKKISKFLTTNYSTDVKFIRWMKTMNNEIKTLLKFLQESLELFNEDYIKLLKCFEDNPNLTSSELEHILFYTKIQYMLFKTYREYDDTLNTDDLDNMELLMTHLIQKIKENEDDD